MPLLNPWQTHSFKTRRAVTCKPDGMFPKSSGFIVHVQLVHRPQRGFFWKKREAGLGSMMGRTICALHSVTNLIIFICLFLGSLTDRKPGVEHRRVALPLMGSNGPQRSAQLNSTQLLPMRVERNAKTNLPTEKTVPLPVLFSLNVIGNIGLLGSCGVSVSGSCRARRRFL